MTMRRWAIGLALAGLALGLPARLPGQPGAMRQPPPVVAPPFDLHDAEAVAQGGRLFQQACTGYCHGKEGRVSRAPKLRGRMFEPDYLYGRIAHGWPPMPAFQTILKPEDIWRQVAYIMSLRDAKED